MIRPRGGMPHARSAKGLRRDSRGVAAMEFALCGAVLFMAVLGTVEVLLFLRTQNALSYAASTAARYASKHSSKADTPATSDNIKEFAMAQIQAAGVSASSTASITPTWPLGNLPGGTVVVTITYSYAPFTAYNIIPARTLTSAATLTIEN